MNKHCEWNKVKLTRFYCLIKKKLQGTDEGHKAEGNASGVEGKSKYSTVESLITSVLYWGSAFTSSLDLLLHWVHGYFEPNVNVGIGWIPAHVGMKKKVPC